MTPPESQCLDYSPQSSVVASVILQVTPCSIIDSNMEEQQGLIVRTPGKLSLSLQNILDLSPHQGANFPTQQVRSALECLHPPQQGGTHQYHLLFPFGAPAWGSQMSWMLRLKVNCNGCLKIDQFQGYHNQKEIWKYLRSLPFSQTYGPAQK